MKNQYFSHKSSPIGELFLVSNEKSLTAIVFAREWPSFLKLHSNLIHRKTKILKQVEKELKEYFSGARNKFTVPLELSGTPFQKQAWQALTKIPYGKTISYQEQALRIQNPKAVRAVGAANGRNPIPIIVPCHRVVGKSGKLTGYAGGLNIKAFLLAHEVKVST